VGDIDFKVIFATKNSNKFQKPRFWKEKSVEDMAKGACNTSIVEMSYVSHPLPKSDFLFGHPNDEDANRDILEMTIEVSELTTELVNKELLMFRQYQVEMDITPILQWWGKHDQCFSWLDFSCQILGILGLKRTL